MSGALVFFYYSDSWKCLHHHIYFMSGNGHNVESRQISSKSLIFGTPLSTRLIRELKEVCFVINDAQFLIKEISTVTG